MAPLREGLTGGQRLFDDASLRLAKGRRLLDPIEAEVLRFGTSLVVYSRYIPRVYIIYTEYMIYMYCLDVEAYMLICSDHLLLKLEISI